MRVLHIMSAVILIALCRVAEAATPADTLVEEGIQMRVKGQYQEALDKFQKAQALDPSPRISAQIGLAEADLKRWTDAEGHLAEALGARDNSWIEKNREILAKALAVIRSHIGRVSVTGPDGTEVFIAGVPAGKLPLAAPLHVNEGTVLMEGRAQGRETASTKVEVPGGGEVTLRLDLPLTAAPVEPDPPFIRDPTTPGAAAPSAPEQRSPGNWKTFAGVGLLSLSAIGIVGGAIWIGLDGDPVCDPEPGLRCSRRYNTKTEGWISIGVGVAAGAAGGLLLWQGSRGEARLAIGVRSLAFVGTF